MDLFSPCRFLCSSYRLSRAISDSRCRDLGGGHGDLPSRISLSSAFVSAASSLLSSPPSGAGTSSACLEFAPSMLLSSSNISQYHLLLFISFHFDSILSMFSSMPGPGRPSAGCKVVTISGRANRNVHFRATD